MSKNEDTVPTRRQRRIVLLVGAAVLSGALLLSNYCAPRNLRSVDPTVSIERGQTDDSSNSRSAVAPNLADDGEVYRTADRLREASAVALVAALYAVSEQAARRDPQNASAVTAGIQSAGLLPPGVTVNGPAMLLSRFAKLLLRFRSDPLSVEVISIPQSREDGPALMVRVPGSEPDGETGTVFVAARLGSIDPPGPFASVSDCVRAGWIDQQINQAEMPQDQQQQVRAWLDARRRH